MSQATEMERSLREILPIPRHQEANVSAPKEWNQEDTDKNVKTNQEDCNISHI